MLCAENSALVYRFYDTVFCSERVIFEGNVDQGGLFGDRRSRSCGGTEFTAPLAMVPALAWCCKWAGGWSAATPLLSLTPAGLSKRLTRMEPGAVCALTILRLVIFAASFSG